MDVYAEVVGTRVLHHDKSGRVLPGSSAGFAFLIVHVLGVYRSNRRPAICRRDKLWHPELEIALYIDYIG